MFSFRNASYRTGPELELTGYSCEDHFAEPDTYLHSWEALLEIILAPASQDLLIDIGMPVQHRNVNFNCRVAFYNKKILLIRPKIQNADNGNYRETRWFTAWTKLQQTEEFFLPRMIANQLGQYTGEILVAFMPWENRQQCSTLLFVDENLVGQRTFGLRTFLAENFLPRTFRPYGHFVDEPFVLCLFDRIKN